MHISIAGNLGSGKSTLCSVLRERYGFDVYSTGAIQREIAKDLSVGTLEMNDVMDKDIKYDHMIDEATTNLAMRRVEPPIIFDSRMAWKFAPESFKVYVVVDSLVAAKRVVGVRHGADESYKSVEEARDKLLLRATLENRRFQKIYHVDNFDYNNYNLVIDTTFSKPEETASIIYKKYKEYCDHRDERTIIMLSPKSLYPLHKIRSLDADVLKKYVTTHAYNNCPVTITKFEGYHYIVDGHHRVFASLINQEDYIKAELFSPIEYPFFNSTSNLLSEIANVGISALYDFEDVAKFRYPSYPRHYKSR